MMADWVFDLPTGWELVQKWGDGWACRQKDGGLRVIVDCEIKDDGNEWLHVSYSRAKQTPTHADTIRVKAAFLRDHFAYSEFPPPDKYVNIHPHCLHLWARADGSAALPEFSAIVEGVGRSI